MRTLISAISDRSTWGVLFTILLASCGQQPQVERVDLNDASGTGEIALTPSPDSAGASWTIAQDGKAIGFGKAGQPPFLSLACDLSDKTAPRLAVIRHALSEPGAKGLFAVIGNGTISRLDLDAELGPDGWEWAGIFPADAPELDVFTGRRDVEATLPGAGTLKIAGSGMPREFIEWCRRGGKIPALASSAPQPG